MHFLTFLIGACFGSFGNVLIHRLPARKSILGRSACPRCGHVLSAWELIPIVSFLLLRARCLHCHRAISWQYPLVELVSGLIFLYAFHSLFLLHATVLALSLWLLFLIAVIDAKHGVIPDALSIPFMIIAFLRSALWWGVGVWFFPVYLLLVFQGAVIGAGFFALQWVISRGRWVGSGDILLGAGMGFMLILPQLLILALMIAYISGAVIAAVLLMLGRVTRKSRLPFAPLLALGTMVSLIY